MIPDFLTFLISLAVVVLLVARKFFEIRKAKNSMLIENLDKVLLHYLNLFFMFLRTFLAKMHVSLIHVLSVKIFGFIKIFIDKVKHKIVSLVDFLFTKLRGVRVVSGGSASVYVKSMLEHKSRLSRER